MVDHDILLAMLDHYEIRGITNKCFKTYPKFRQQFVSINGYNSECSSMPVGVRQGSILGPLLFLLYIKGLNLIIKDCKVTKVSLQIIQIYYILTALLKN